MDDLRDRLFGLAWNPDALEEMCRAERVEILAAFPAWKTVPPDVRADPKAMQGYAQGLITTARVFAERLGDPSLIALLQGAPDDNPIEKWRRELGAIHQLMETDCFADAQKRLTALLAEAKISQGTGVDQLQAYANGFLGECLLQQGRADRAVPHFDAALAAAARIHDGDAQLVYHARAYEAHRYAGEPERAAARADQHAHALAAAGRAPEAHRYRRKAQIARVGEPRNRVICVCDGAPCELDEVPADADRVQFVFERNRASLRTATALLERGGKAGHAGRHEEALGCFAQAADADPFEPHAHYEAGVALLELRRYADAVEAYGAAEERAPGWFQCRADLWLAKELAAGRVKHETFAALRWLEDGGDPPESQLRRADQALVAAPDVGGLHLARGRLLHDLGRAPAARDAYRAGLACQPDPDTRSRLEVRLAMLVEEPERTVLLTRAADPSGNLVAAATAKLALAQQRARAS